MRKHQKMQSTSGYFTSVKERTNEKSNKHVIICVPSEVNQSEIKTSIHCLERGKKTSAAEIVR